MANVSDFISKLKGGGARQNQFKVTMPFPGFASVGGETENMSFLCSATQLPSSELGELTVNFRGRPIHMAGDRTFQTWSTTIINNTIKSYTFRGLFPLTIGTVDLNYDPVSALETFECTWRYQYWESNTTT
jgi:hypothetical protein